MLTHSIRERKTAKRKDNPILRALKAQSYSPTQGRYSRTTQRKQQRKVR